MCELFAWLSETVLCSWLGFVCFLFSFFAAVILKLAQTTNMLITVFKWNKMDRWTWVGGGGVGGWGG